MGASWADRKVRYKGKKWKVIYDEGKRIMLARWSKKKGRNKAIWVDEGEVR